jgi:hypothetical protein
MSLSGTRLLAVLARHLDEKTVESILVPTFADLQHETLRAGTDVPRRWVALVHGYAAVVRLLFWHGLLWRSPMRRLISVLVLGGVGAALVVLIAFSTGDSDGRAGLGATFAVAMLAAVVFRFLKVGGSFRQVFVNCFSVGIIVGAALLAWLVALESLSPRSWYSYVFDCLLLTGWVALGSAMAAAVAWQPAPGAEPASRRRLLHVAVASASFVAGFVVRTLLSGAGRSYIWAIPNAVIFGAYVAFFFAAFALAVYLPVMAGARRALPRLDSRVSLAVIGAALFPIPLLGIPLLQPHPAFPWSYLQQPALMLWTSVPYVLAGAVLGWLVAERPRESARATS